jgi:hypothetical protein
LPPTAARRRATPKAIPCLPSQDRIGAVVPDHGDGRYPICDRWHSCRGSQYVCAVPVRLLGSLANAKIGRQAEDDDPGG